MDRVQRIKATFDFLGLTTEEWDKLFMLEWLSGGDIECLLSQLTMPDLNQISAITIPGKYEDEPSPDKWTVQRMKSHADVKSKRKPRRFRWGGRLYE